MITNDDFELVQIGDQVDVGPLFGGLSQEGVKLITKAKTDDTAEFTATYFGVTLGRWVATRKNNDLVWSF